MTEGTKETNPATNSESSEAVAQAGVKTRDRVKRKSFEGCLGTVQDVREEVTASSIDSNERGLLVSVLWDNGTFSYFTPDALEVV